MAQIEGITIYFEGNKTDFDKTSDGVKKEITLLKKMTAETNKEFKNFGNMSSLEKSLEHLHIQFELINREIKYFADYYKERLDSGAGQTELNNIASDWQTWKNALIDVQVQINNTEDKLREMSGQHLEAIIGKEEYIEEATKDINEQLGKSVENSRMFSESMEAAGDKIITMGEKVESVGRSLSRVSSGARTFLSESIQSAGDFSLAFANVVRVLEDADPTTVQELEKSIRQMATEIPASAEEIAESVQLMAQLGVPTENLMKFSRVMIDLGNTTDMSAEEAGEAIAKLYNIMGSDLDTVDRFASTILDLGRKSAATESEITEMAFRVSAAGRQMGLSEQEIIGLATALSSVGLKAQGGGTAISRVMYDIEKAVQGLKDNSDEIISTFAETTGMSAKEFKKAWGEDVLGTLNKVIVGMYEYEDEGGRLIALLDEMGISNVRTLDAMGRLAGKQDSIKRYTDLANKAWEENSVLAESTDLIYGEFNNRLKVFLQNWEEFKIQVGEVALPILEQLLEIGKGFIDRLRELDPQQKELIAKMIAFVGVLSPMLIGVGKLFQIIGGFVKGGFITNLVNQFSTWKSMGLSTFQALKTVGSSNIAVLIKKLKLLLNPVTAVIAVLVACYKASEDFRNAVNNLAIKIGNELKPIMEAILDAFSRVWGFIVNYLFPIFKSLGDLLAVTLMPILESLWGWFSKYILPVLKTVASFIFDTLLVVLESLAVIIKEVIDEIKLLWDQFSNSVPFQILKAGLDTTIGTFSSLATGISNLFGWFDGLIQKAKDYLGLTEEIEVASRKLSPSDGTGNSGGGGGRYRPNQGYTDQFQSDGFGGIVLYNTITVQNTGAAINDAEVQRWGREIADTVNYHLGRMI